MEGFVNLSSSELPLVALGTGRVSFGVFLGVLDGGRFVSFGAAKGGSAGFLRAFHVFAKCNRAVFSNIGGGVSAVTPRISVDGAWCANTWIGAAAWRALSQNGFIRDKGVFVGFASLATMGCQWLDTSVKPTLLDVIGLALDFRLLQVVKAAHSLAKSHDHQEPSNEDVTAGKFRKWGSRGKQPMAMQNWIPKRSKRNDQVAL
ncbi:hypothetical protein RHSIM_Rhsim12G0146700 [Rhododendron simsii]|uniref:Uncharacterized protein n=1 Tax=Rhododendron simsii TaxID=118357 RepID=A0A834G8I0_RHOSS|nr:hypothetical protein RHSIM_Rhsim12G0146700 [Rhododendron simsii]